ncbi:MAG TPA: hypothetical protein VIL34_15485 [Actinopolymorphaceae bacterium]|jgi:phenylalanyl-tRNA synthetase alpha chain
MTSAPSTAAAYLSAEELRRCLEIRDLTDPAQGAHALQLMVDALTTALATAWRCKTRVRREHPVVSLADNYDNLGFAPDAVTREARYTRYVDDQHVLRSHGSAMIPPALRQLAGEQAPADDILFACPAMCYRRDRIGWQHTATPHHLDLWRITRARECSEDDLLEMIGIVVQAALPGARWRTIPKVHPYTLQGRQIDVWWQHPAGRRSAKGAQGQWIEIGECGLAGPSVLAGSGLAVPPWNGLAMGLGLDRLVMLRKGVPDIRLLRSTDPRVASQMLDLEPYRPVSHLPPVRRDLSIVVGADTEVDVEVLGDRVRNALGPDADVAEEVDLLSDTPYDMLPATARERLGIAPGQRNLLVRLVLRPLERTLTDAEANELRDRVYAALHEGTAAQWAAR